MYRQLKPRVLVIDDDLLVGDFLRSFLEETGEYVVFAENDPFAAVAQARFFKPDLLIVDINMPGRSGIEVAKLVRQEPWLRHRPILFYSGAEGAQEAALKAGSDGPTAFLIKGGPVKTVLATVERLASERLHLYRTLTAAVPPRFQEEQ